MSVDVPEIDGGGFHGEVWHLPGCLAQADSLENLAQAIREPVRDDFAGQRLLTEETAQRLPEIP